MKKFIAFAILAALMAGVYFGLSSSNSRPQTEVQVEVDKKTSTTVSQDQASSTQSSQEQKSVTAGFGEVTIVADGEEIKL